MKYTRTEFTYDDSFYANIDRYLSDYSKTVSNTTKKKIIHWLMNTIWTHTKRGFEINTNVTELGRLLRPIINEHQGNVLYVGNKCTSMECILLKEGIG
jgi:metal-sulfur cluster biosynthetic enzyme